MKILHTDYINYSKDSLNRLRALGELVCLKPHRKELLRLVGDIDILVVRMDTKVDGQILDAAPRLKIVATATTGLNHLDTDCMKERGIALISLSGEREFLKGIPSTAEFTFGLLLALMRFIPQSFDAVKNYEFNTFDFQGYELMDKIMGVVGYGRIGTMVARYAKAFGMKVIANDPYVDPQKFSDDGVTRVTLDELLSQSDIISLHPPLGEETANLINARSFFLMKPGVYLINTSRGEVVDEQALLQALESGRIAGAAIDTLCNENELRGKFADHPLVEYAKTHRNLIVTPHIGGMARESVYKTSDFIVSKITDQVSRSSI